MDTRQTPSLPPSSVPSSLPSTCAAAHERFDGDQPCGQGRTRHGFFAGLLLGILGAGLVGFAIGATMPVAEAALHAFGPHDRGGHDGPPTAEEAREHAEFFVGFALHRLDATDDQKARVKGIVDGAITDLLPVVEKHRANRDALHAVLGAATIDRAAIEQLRVEELALADSLSRTLASTIADTAEVLTVGQRQELLGHLARFRHHR